MSAEEKKPADDEHQDVESVPGEKAHTDEPDPMPEDVDTEQDADPIAALTEEVATLKDQVLRARAETENVRRRADRDRADASAYAVTGFARDMLSVSDNMRRALDSMPEDVADEMKAFVEGVEMTERELLKTMEKYGIEKVEPEVGEKFDHKFHQAMFEVPTADHAPGSVMQVVAAGYVIKDRLLRPAMVGVAKGEAKAVDTEA
ncbi:MAG: nucleotide exchange factor GrpE [Kordiimonadaceae bacterium]|nr:nucleotide exchange factor GrpE [Kordiimonadaceae bacterium]MBO6568378.1 nucleotide exchange factor GrpE [Kordiimonadaceae bacterium]MBO6963893.1 nucleotide exchange factor GrpE [Kordiimonadaceae bacterium]